MNGGACTTTVPQISLAEMREQKGNKNFKEKGASRGEQGARAPLGGAWRSLDAAGREIRQLQTNSASWR